MTHVVDTTALALARWNKGRTERYHLAILEPKPYKEGQTGKARARIINRTTNTKQTFVDHPTNTRISMPVPKPIMWEEIPHDADCYHLNYVEYLEQCFDRHYGAIVSPTVVWFTILGELAAHIKSNAEHYRPIFTTAPGETEIVVLADTTKPHSGKYWFRSKAFTSRLTELVPGGTDRVSLFLPGFSTDSEMAGIATMASFCDAVSPYYSYGMLACGIPQVRIEGTPDEWFKLLWSLDRMSGAHVGHNSILDRLDSNWIDGIHEFVGHIIATLDGTYSVEEAAVVWNDFAYAERCGSGSQQEIKGWFKLLFTSQNRPCLATRNNWPSQIASVNYWFDDLNEREHLTANFGLYYSRVEETTEGAFLVPDYGFTVETHDEKQIKQLQADAEEEIKSWVLFDVEMTAFEQYLRPLGYPSQGGLYKDDTQWVFTQGSRSQLEALAAKHGFQFKRTNW